jgi:ADP-heptose:LPS heptosyltransferase
LARRTAIIGDAQLEQDTSWSFNLRKDEEESTFRLVPKWIEGGGFLACGMGAKSDVQDWGLENWCRLLSSFSVEFPGAGLAIVGSADEHARGEIVGRLWHGPVANLSGSLAPRQSAAVLKRARLFAGHDSGPMHVAAAVQTPCVAIFSAHNLPGVWYPHGTGHRVIYHQTDCYGCGLLVCHDRAKACITSITVPEVLSELREAWLATTEVERTDPA